METEISRRELLNMTGIAAASRVAKSIGIRYPSEEERGIPEIELDRMGVFLDTGEHYKLVAHENFPYHPAIQALQELNRVQELRPEKGDVSLSPYGLGKALLYGIEIVVLEDFGISLETLKERGRNAQRQDIESVALLKQQGKISPEQAEFLTVWFSDYRGDLSEQSSVGRQIRQIISTLEKLQRQGIVVYRYTLARDPQTKEVVFSEQGEPRQRLICSACAPGSGFFMLQEPEVILNHELIHVRDFLRAEIIGPETIQAKKILENTEANAWREAWQLTQQDYFDIKEQPGWRPQVHPLFPTSALVLLGCLGWLFRQRLNKGGGGK